MLNKQEIFDSLRGYSLTVASASLARLELKFWNWPWLLIRGLRVAEEPGPISGSRANGEADAVLDKFWIEDQCCLDSWVGVWLQAACGSRQQLNEAVFQSWLAEFARKGLATNMGLEGLLAMFKGACPTSNLRGTFIPARCVNSCVNT